MDSIPELNIENEKSNEIVSPILTPLPEYSPQEFNKLVQSVPSYLIEDERIENAKEVLDTINIWWRTQQDTVSGLDRFKSASTLPEIPKLEAQEAQKQFLSLQIPANNINVKINRLLDTGDGKEKDSLARKLLRIAQSPRRFESMGKIKEQIETFNEQSKNIPQIIAVCEAIKQASELNLPTKQIRQKIAQYAWEELISIFPYAKVQDEVLTTRDGLEIEKDDIRKTIGSPLWTQEEQEKARKLYLEYQEQMDQGNYYPDLIDSFKLFYNFTKGIIPNGISAIHILQIQEEILKGLYDEDVFESEEE